MDANLFIESNKHKINRMGDPKDQTTNLYNVVHDRITSYPEKLVNTTFVVTLLFCGCQEYSFVDTATLVVSNTFQAFFWPAPLLYYAGLFLRSLYVTM